MVAGRAVTALPSGTVTFLLSDAEASSALWQRGLASADEAFTHLAALVDGAAERFDGVVLRSRGEGDSHFVVFDRASSAVTAAIELQRAIGSTTWPPDAAVAVRVAIHTGEPLLRADDYFGPVVNETARLRSLGHGGQVLASPVTVLLARPGVGDDVDFLSLGVFRIRDFRHPQEVFQVSAPGLASAFRPLQALDTVLPPLVAVVRLDVSGSRRLLQSSDYAGVVEAGRSFARLARSRFDALGGYALQVAGDSVTAAFGTPALAVQFVRQVAAPLKLGGFTIHAGLHAGSVDVTPNGPTGHAVMVAEALLAMAAPAQILATRAIAELTRSDSTVVCEPLGDETPSILGRTWELYSIAVA